MIHQVGHKVISFTNGLEITDIWNSTKQVTHKKSHIESHLKRIWMWKSDFTLQITPPYTIATNRTLWHHKTPALCKIYTLKPGNLQWQQWSELNLTPRALYYSASRVRWEGEDPGNQVGQSLVKDKIKQCFCDVKMYKLTTKIDQRFVWMGQVSWKELQSHPETCCPKTPLTTWLHVVTANKYINDTTKLERKHFYNWLTFWGSEIGRVIIICSFYWPFKTSTFSNPMCMWQAFVKDMEGGGKGVHVHWVLTHFYSSFPFSCCQVF